MVQKGWDGQVGLPGLRGTVWYIPWDPSVQRGTDGMGWTSGTTWLKGYCMVRPMGSQCTTWYRWDGMDKWDWLKVYCMVRPMGSQCTMWYRWNGMDKCDYLA